jgi:short-subunit dehydrogenase
MAQPLCVIVGAGPGNGLALGKCFAASGYRVALLARDAARLTQLASTIPGSTPIPCDASDSTSIEQAFARVADLGSVRTLIYNAGNFVVGSVRDTDPATLEAAFRLNCSGCLACVQRVLPGMLERGQGTIVITGATASRRGAAGALPFATAKAAQRVMAESMARALGPLGIHVAYVVIDGVIDTPHARGFFAQKPDEFFMRADEIAQAILHLVEQGRSAWSFEIDLRPFGERW